MGAVQGCCALRSKDGKPALDQGTSRKVATVASAYVGFGDHVVFAPLWATPDAGQKKRIAVIGSEQLRVYEIVEKEESVSFELCLNQIADPGESFTALSFWSSSESTKLVAAVFKAVPIASSGKAKAGEDPLAWQLQKSAVLRVWDLSTQEDKRPEAVDNWHQVVRELGSSGKRHQQQVSCIAVNPTKVVSADDQGECFVWNKADPSQGLVSKLIHAGGVGGIDCDRVCLYSVGALDRTVGVWDIRNLNALQTIDVAATPGLGKMRALLGVCRPASRWAAVASQKTPAAQGFIFVSAWSEQGEGLLMEWTLGTPKCRSLVRAHAAKVNCMAYGPYDNGPILSTGADGHIRVWHHAAMKCISAAQEKSGSVKSLCVEPQVRFYGVTDGGVLKAYSLVQGDGDTQTSDAGSSILLTVR
mmetsp:Transcript_22862/g.50157  ORF Transcript_22862/g.50157 Transcript_22862/m.50157 type:complete len:416 (-) Transcript_22862:79-1326(-)